MEIVEIQWHFKQSKFSINAENIQNDDTFNPTSDVGLTAISSKRKYCLNELEKVSMGFEWH